MFPIVRDTGVIESGRLARCSQLAGALFPLLIAGQAKHLIPLTLRWTLSRNIQLVRKNILATTG